MRITATPDAGRFVREHGGRLYVWAARPCCGGTRFVEAATTPPSSLGGFDPITVDGFDLFFRGAGGLLPDELTIQLHGRRRPYVAASWDGCAYVL